MNHLPREAQLDLQTARWNTFLRQIPALRTSQEEMAVSLKQLKEDRRLGKLSVQIYVMQGLDLLADLHASAVTSLEEGHYQAAQTLMRDGMVAAIDVMYVMQDPQADRLTGATRHLLEVQRQHAQMWRDRASPEQRDQAQSHLDAMDAHARLQPWYAKAPAWPDFDARACAVGWENVTRPLLGSVIDAGQMLARQTMDALQCEQENTMPQRLAAHRLRRTQISADAVYAVAVALWLYAEALLRTAALLSDPVALTVAETTAERLKAVLGVYVQYQQSHDTDGEGHIYFRSR